MSTLEERSIDQLADMILNVLWQDLLELWSIIRKKMDSEGVDSVKLAFDAARKRFIEGPFSDHLEVRWGMNLCLHCNDDNIEKNGISYVKPSGDGLEFNQCLNCRIGILYDLVTARASMDSYVIGLGKPDQFNGMSFFWSALVPDKMKKFEPMYEVISKGQWMGTISFDGSLTPRFLPFASMTDSIERDADGPWVSELPDDVNAAVEAFIGEAKAQIEVALAIKQ
ncbi:MAG: hypothetical protein ACXADL_00870 [Candidatus Thorarchaeota archaeon]|jgi:hypothetical protein